MIEILEYLDNSPLIKQAINEIYQTYGDTVSVNSKKKSLLKFGRNELVGTSQAMIMTLPAGVLEETYVSDNLITHMSSATDTDTVVLTIEGHTISGGNLTFVTQNVSLTGQTAKALTTPLARVNRAYNIGATNLGGPVYFFENDTLTTGVPDTDAKVHMIIRAGKNQTEKAATSVSSTDYWIITNIYADILEKVAAFADVQLETKKIGQVFRNRAGLAVSSGAGRIFDFKPYFIVQNNSDVRLVATASAASTDVSGGIQGFLASII